MQNSTFEMGLSYGPPSTKYASSNINPIQSEKEIYSPSKLNSCSPVHKISVVNIDNEKTKEAKQLCDQVGQWTDYLIDKNFLMIQIVKFVITA